jgi:integrase
VNPARDLMAIKGASQARKRALSVAELQAYWRRIDALPGVDGALLRFHLLTGGQRVEQLARLKLSDYDKDAQAVCLYDGKGRRVEAREHVVPLIPTAIAALETLNGGALGDYVYTATGGMSGAVYATLQSRLRHVVEAMAEAKELEKGEFTVGDLRRSVETQLAAKGISQDVRAQLQSHGLSGVQARHYDRHDYMDEKREALETLYDILTKVAEKGRVVRFRPKRA